MSDPSPTARQFVHELLGCSGDRRLDGTMMYHTHRCDRLTAAIAARDAASDAREDRLREALERIRDCTSRADAGGCETCQDEAHAALAAISPRSDR